jgi:hypothetical protein
MNEPQPPPNDREPPSKPRAAKPARRLFEAGAAVLGIGAGVAFADPVLAAAGGVWHGFVLPAYQAMIDNGLMAWCF